MSSGTNLTREQKERLTPVIEACANAFRTNLQGQIQATLRLADPRGQRALRDEDPILARSDCAYMLLSASGDLAGKAAFVCSLPLAITLSSLLLGFPEESVPDRAKSPTLATDEEDAFREIGNMLVGGLDSAFKESSFFAVNLKLEEIGTTSKWDRSTAFDSDDLLRFAIECRIGNQTGEDVHLVFEQGFLTQLIGLDESTSREAEGDRFRADTPLGRPTLTLLGVAMSPTQEKIVDGLVRRYSLRYVGATDVREVLTAVVTHDVACVIVGDRTNAQAAKTPNITVATLKRLRAHPKGRALPVLYFVGNPERHHVTEVAHLGVRDIVVGASTGRDAEERVRRFIEASLSEATGEAAA
jgi:hypothetical protein